MSDLDPAQSAHLEPGGPALAAAAWFSAIVDYSNLATAWELTDDPLQLSLVQGWLMNTGRGDVPDRDRVAAALAQGPGSSDWADFARWRLGRWRGSTFSRFVEEGWGLVTVPEYAGPELEFVRIAPGREGRTIKAQERIVVQTLTVRFVAGAWLLAGVGRTLAVPGWPPSEEEIPSDFSP